MKTEVANNTLNNNEIFGMFLWAKDQLAKNASLKENWKELGATAFEQDGFEKSKGKKGDRLVVFFPSEPPKSLKDEIKSAGLKWNPSARFWIGIAPKKEIEEILDGVESNIQVRNPGKIRNGG